MEELNKIIQAIEHMDKETLKNTLAYLIKVYIIDKKLLYDGAAAEPSPPVLSGTAPLTFTELMTEIKRNYQMEELKKFSIEGGRVYIALDNKRYQISSSEDSGTQPRPTQDRVRQDSKREAGINKGNFRNIEMDE